SAAARRRRPARRPASTSANPAEMLGFGRKRDGLARSPAADLYIELLKNCVSNSVYDDDLDLMRGSFTRDAATGKLTSAQPGAMDETGKYLGLVWPSRAHTMIGIPLLDNLRACIEAVLDAGVEA